jgi:mannosyltransferase OCH1-like enzyme
MENQEDMIPKIIHQLWSAKEVPLPSFLKEWSKSWIKYNPTWQYEFWDDDRMDSFIRNFFSEYIDIYYKFHYYVQRWDAIRYLILWKFGGMYVDFDYECLEPFEGILYGKECCFSLEPASNGYPGFKKIDYNFNNALMACVPNHSFIQTIIREVFSPVESIYPASDKFHYVLSTTGPYLLINLYEKYDRKDEIYLIPAELVSPFGIAEIKAIMAGIKNETFEEKLKKAKAIHYFLGNWKKLY